MKLQHKTALVMGGSSGIGAAVAARLAADGAAVAVIASGDLSKAERVAERIRTVGGRAYAFTCEVRDVAAIGRLVGDVEQASGPVDILVNSAGLYVPTPIGETTEADYERMADINFKGTFFAINAVVPGMKTRRYGKIVNISSIAATWGIGTYSLYCATKAAVDMLTRALARELAPYNININAIAPGNTATPLNEELRTDPAHREYIAAMENMTPSNRTFSPPTEMAAICAFLVSDEARSLYGESIIADEGITTGVG